MLSTRNLPIRQKMILIILVASGLALLATGAAVVIYEVTTFRPRMEEESARNAEMLSVNLHAPLAFDYPDDAREALQSLENQSEISVACVYRYDASRFASFGGEEPIACPLVPEELGARFTGEKLELFHRIELDGETVGFLFLGYELPPLYARLPQYSLMVVAVLLALLAVSVLFSVALKRLISGPILELAQAAQEVRDRHDYRVRVGHRGHDEIGNLTATFNEMLATIELREAALQRANEEQRQLQDQLIQAQKMESIGRLAGGVAHDFNNLLTVIIGCTDLTVGQLPPESPLRRLLDNIRQATTQATELTNQLLAFARRQIIEPRIIDLNSLVLGTEKMLHSLIGDDIELVAIPCGDLWPVEADPSQIMQILVNLSVNARDAMPHGGKLTIETRNVTLSQEVRDEVDMAAGEYVMLEVRDTGVGISEEVRAHLFEPFFTTKDTGRGTGLGLAMCYGIIKQSHGHLTVESELDQGASFKVYLPRAHEAVEAAAPERLPPALPAGEETVLIVEDNDLVRVTAVEQLLVHGYNVMDAANGLEALRLLESYEAEAHLLITDVVMPEMGGKELSQRLQATHPDLRTLYVSGYPSGEIARHGVLESGIFFLQKPYTTETLIRKVRKILDEVRSERAGKAE